MTVHSSARTVGLWSACFAALLSIIYVIGQLLEWYGALGSQGGPNSSSTPLGIAILLTPSLLLGSTFLVLMAALHAISPADRRVFTQIGLAFAIAYATLVSLVYFVQLTFVGPRLASGDVADIGILLFVPYQSFLFAVDLLGYSFMSLATLFGAFGLPPSGFSRGARLAMIANGALLPFLALQMFFPELIWVAAMWAITFPSASILLALVFRSLPVGSVDPKQGQG